MTRLHRAGMSASFCESNLRIVMIRGLRMEYSHVVSLICETDDKCSTTKMREILQLHGVRIEKAPVTTSTDPPQVSLVLLFERRFLI